MTLLKPYVHQFDAWLKEAAFINALSVAHATSESERETLASRSLELRAEVETSFRRFKTETAQVSRSSRVIDVSGSYERLIRLLQPKGVA